jgi:hypothetical protein
MTESFVRHRHSAAPLSRAHAFTGSEVWLPKKVFATDRSWRRAAVHAPRGRSHQGLLRSRQDLCPRRAPVGDTCKRIVASNDVGLLEDKNPHDNGKFEEIDLAEWVQSSPRYLLSKDFCLD